MNFENNVIGSNYCKQRFKAIEGFLRRVAYNLGNSPSQTEVKIISCIPVDVTDLQQQICQLQKELDETRKRCKVKKKEEPCVVPAPPPLCPTSTMHADACPPIPVRIEQEVNTADLCCTDNCCKKSSSYMLAGDSASKQRRSAISLICTTDTELLDACPDEPSAAEIPKSKCKTKNIFSMKKKGNRKDKCSTQYVYCAQTETNSPFFNKSRSKTTGATSKNLYKEANRVGPTYLANIIERTEREMPYSSEFSSPVCRDSVPTGGSRNSPREFDVCSCCHGQFQNIDDHMDYRKKIYTYPRYDTTQVHNGSAYYDSNLYDLVPVKEKPVKVRTNIGTQRRKETRKAPIKFWHQKRPTELVPPTIVNYCTVPPVKEHQRVLQKRRDYIINRMAAKEFKAVSPQPQRDSVASNICSVDYSTVYTKQIDNENRMRVFPTNIYKQNDVACSPIMVNNVDCQTTTFRADPPPEDKTEITLNQIKTILQSVLTEVKTNVKLGNPAKLQKDAVVQKGPSQSEAFESQLKSFTYSPYNMNPYIASCSRQMPSGHFTYPGMQEMQGRCVQQYPLLIQPQNRPCESCFKPGSITKTGNTFRPANNATATATATNTEPTKQRSKETEQLIKEIYKSLNVGIEPSNNINVGGAHRTNAKSSINYLDDKESEEVADSISEIFRNANALDSTITRTTDVTSVSKFTSDKYFVESEHAILKSRISEKDEYSRADSTEREIKTVQISRDLASESQSEDTEQSTTDDTDDEVAARDAANTVDTKKEKDGIFKKMFKIFKSRQKHRKKNEESESDSEDYQTVYSHQVADPKPKIVRSVRSRPHSKVIYSKRPQQNRSRTRSPEKRKSPYMEQEYRRRWDEKLIFHEGRHTSEKPRFATSSPRRQTPLYYQNYEARSAMVDNVRRVPLRMPGNIQKQQRDDGRYTAYSVYGGNRPRCPDHAPNYPGTKSTYSRNNHHYVACNHHTGNNPNFRGNSPRYIPTEQVSPNYGIDSTSAGNSRRSKQARFTKSTHNGQPKSKPKGVMSSKRLAWLKRNKLNKCGKQWKELLLDG